METLRAILEEGREEGIFRTDLEAGRTALVLCQIITVGLSFDPNNYARKEGQPYALDLDTMLGVLAEGLIANSER